ncbi:potassium-transporting ATPase subunit KdpC [Actinopolymorpha pittospori]|uniref:Potassium-transporting ATPase KdpC subunit n=1 Tax=Actinopolymorpha pittospori TaxID=648752 RepID=A0A927N769_9ACTN|nr:K+-transporting ATPase ATPase C chain [Actinopolymorpha pittospori]
MLATVRQLGAALRALIVLTVILGLIYPFAVWAVGQVAFKDQANGSLIHSNGQVVGSRLIGQEFDGPRWFHSRPSATGDTPYDAMNSYGSNLGPTNPDLVKMVKERKATVAKENGVPQSEVPPDAVTASGSGLDPHISPEYAAIQVNRVAEARGLSVEQVKQLVKDNTDNPSLGFLGEPGVNVVELNLALNQASGRG